MYPTAKSRSDDSRIVSLSLGDVSRTSKPVGLSKPGGDRITPAAELRAVNKLGAQISWAKPKMAVNASQQSTVREFVCLWTVNKRQKLKNWNDGTLRFHEFNHRAMVYDDN